MRALYNIWLTVQLLDAVASVMAAWYLLRLRQRFGYYIAGVFIAISAEAIIAATSLYLFWNGELTTTISPAFAIARIVGRGLKAASLWLMVLYCLGYVNGSNKHPDG